MYRATVFGSNYASEVSMPDDFWRNRVRNPSARTFVAVRLESEAVLSSVTLIQNIPVPPGLKVRLGIEATEVENELLLHWAVNAVYTGQESRRKGIGREVMGYALKYAADTSISEGKSCLCTVLVKQDNIVARSMYEKAGFMAVGETLQDGTLQLFLWTPLRL